MATWPKIHKCHRICNIKQELASFVSAITLGAKKFIKMLQGQKMSRKCLREYFSTCTCGLFDIFHLLDIALHFSNAAWKANKGTPWNTASLFTSGSRIGWIAQRAHHQRWWMEHWAQADNAIPDWLYIPSRRMNKEWHGTWCVGVSRRIL